MAKALTPRSRPLPADASVLDVMRKRRSVRVYRRGKVTDEQLRTILEAARWAPSGANTQPWEFVVTRDRAKMRKVRRIYDNEWRQRKAEDPIHYKGLKKDYVGQVSALVLVCADPRTMKAYLTTRQPADREKLFQASVANAVEHMMLAAAAMGLGTVWVSVREEVEAELRALFRVPQPLRLLWIVPIGHARSWPKAKPRRAVSEFVHFETYDPGKLRKDADIRAWPK
ncbi:MAG TPA: nitroreductase family protein [Candidatus Acidoferrales bacterium]|nr:nitroreductase family protein [Candidatus Acidoferrales bacterium]